MIILYIPFNEPTDLTEGAEIWRQQSADTNIVIIRHGESFNLKPCRSAPIKQFTIYILAHGISQQDGTYQVYSHGSDSPNTTSISMDVVTDRFLENFLYYKQYIDSVKLYFCNDQGTELKVAQAFSRGLVNFDRLKVDYFSGTLYPAQQNQLFSFFAGEKRPVAQVQKSLDYRVDTSSYKPSF